MLFHVVNAGGTYARQIAEWVGYNLPMANTTHHYFITDAVDEFKDLDHELPVVRDDQTYSGYIRMEQKSGLIGIYEKKPPATVWDDGTPWEAENELFDPDYDQVMECLEQALIRMPVLEKYGIKRAVHGAIPMPPDGNMGVRIDTDAGLSGWGEICPIGATYLPAHANGVEGGLRELAPHLLGLDPTNTGLIDAAMTQRGKILAVVYSLSAAILVTSIAFALRG